MPKIDVCLSPELIHLFDIKEKVVVIIDILRATSTICSILNNGAKEVIPVPDLEKAKKYLRKGYIVGAERGGKTIDGFSYGNSPFDYPSEVVKDKSIVLTTSNGTKALHLSKDADQILIGSFLNLNEIVNKIKTINKDCLLFCAGWKGHFSLEDSCCAGALVHYLSEHFELCSDSGIVTKDLYLQYKNDLMVMIKKSAHFKRLNHFGVNKDFDLCITQNLFNQVPFWNGSSIMLG